MAGFGGWIACASILVAVYLEHNRRDALIRQESYERKEQAKEEQKRREEQIRQDSYAKGRRESISGRTWGWIKKGLFWTVAAPVVLVDVVLGDPLDIFENKEEKK